MIRLVLLCYALIQPDFQADLDSIVQLYKSMGHPAVAVLGAHTSAKDKKPSPVGYVFFWHEPRNKIVSDELIRPGGKVFIISMPEGVEPSPEALRGVKIGGN